MLSLCLCFKDSAAYLEEWMLFHFVQGFRKYYLYDNGSTDDWLKVVTPWIRAGLAETTSYPGLAVQQDVYDDCLRRARGKVEWLGFLDDDEFLYPVDPRRRLADVLAEYRAHAGVAVSWILYGSGGAQRTSAEWVIERFCATSAAADHHVKCLVRPERILRSKVIGHAFEPLPGWQVVDENQRPLTEALNLQASAKTLRVNHYLVRSWEEWRLRRGRPQANTGIVTPHPEDLWRGWDREWSRELDASATSYVPAMRAAARELGLETVSDIAMCE